MLGLCGSGFYRYRRSAPYGVSQVKDFVGVRLRMYPDALYISGHMLSGSLESAFNALALEMSVRPDLSALPFGSLVYAGVRCTVIPFSLVQFVNLFPRLLSPSR